ncbi:hypothetical protein Trydic_g3469 [Trypoxylus dichotomus]
MDQESIKGLCYSDDAILMADNDDDLQRLLYRFQTKAKGLNMQISMEKTELMVIAKEPIRCKLAVNDKLSRQRSKTLQQDVRAQFNKASRISGYLRDLIWRNKYMSAGSKVYVYKTAVRPVLTYVAAARADTIKAKNMMRAAEMKILRTIKGVSLMDQIRSKVIREDLETTILEGPPQQNDRGSMGKMRKRMKIRILADLPADLPSDGARAATYTCGFQIKSC